MGKFFTLAEIAKALGVTDKTVRSWISAGHLRAIPVTRTESDGVRERYRVRESDFDDFLNRQATAPPPKPRKKRKPANVKEFIK